MSGKLSDGQLADVESLAHAAIHELVFFIHHCENDQPEDADDCLNTVALNIDQIAEVVNKLKEEA